MKILQVHNQYSSGLGGEDVVLATERTLLLEHGHTVGQYLATNSELFGRGFAKPVISGVQSVWSSRQFRALRRKLDETRPDVVHVHNTFASLSPSIFWAVKDAGVPCVLTLHNYRLICATGALFRDGTICQECLGRLPLGALRHRCRYKGSALAGALVATTQIFHRLLETYVRTVDAFIVLSQDFASLLKRAGYPAAKIHVKHNSVIDELKCVEYGDRREPQVVYVGQITQAKGVDLLLQAWTCRGSRRGRLTIVGDGPDRERLQRLYESRGDILWVGRLERKDVFETIRSSRFLVMPSIWLEPFGLSAVEALMLATPVIVSDRVSIGAYVRSGSAGVVHDARSAERLAEALDNSMSMDEDAWTNMARSARQVYVQNFTPAAGYVRLLEIYQAAMQPVS